MRGKYRAATRVVQLAPKWRSEVAYFKGAVKSLNENESKLGGSEFVFQPSLTADLLISTSF